MLRGLNQCHKCDQHSENLNRNPLVHTRGRTRWAKESRIQLNGTITAATGASSLAWHAAHNR
jgi:hypothetical protein